MRGTCFSFYLTKPYGAAINLNDIAKSTGVAPAVKFKTNLFELVEALKSYPLVVPPTSCVELSVITAELPLNTISKVPNLLAPLFNSIA